MSRVFEAIQRSQGGSPDPNNSPLVDQSEAASAVAVEAPPAPGMSAPERIIQSDWLNVPADRVLHPVPTPEQRLVVMTDPDSHGAEMFRVLATRLAHMQQKRQLQKLLVTSSVVDEGKSVVAANLALTLARRSGEKVLLIEADLRRPTVSALFSSTQLRGIGEWNEGKLALEDSLYQIRDLPVWLLAAGRPIDEPLPLLESGRFVKMLEAVRIAALRLDHYGCDADVADGRFHLDCAPGRRRAGGGARRLHPQEGPQQGAGDHRQEQAAGRGLQPGDFVEPQRQLLRLLLLQQVGQGQQGSQEGSEESSQRSEEGPIGVCMIRLFNAYFPTRTLLLTVTEALIVTLAFVVAVCFWAGTAMDANIYLLYENGLGRIGLLVGIFITLMYYFDLYDTTVLSNRREVITRLVGVLGCAFVALSVLYYAFPEISLVGTTLWLGVGIVAVTVPAWRKLFFVLNRSARFSERARSCTAMARLPWR